MKTEEKAGHTKKIFKIEIEMPKTNPHFTLNEKVIMQAFEDYFGLFSREIKIKEIPSEGRMK